MRLLHFVSFFSILAASRLTAFAAGADTFAGRATLTGTSATATLSSATATKEVGEPNHAGDPGGKSVWWTWTAPYTGQVIVDTVGSDFDTVLAVYTGNAVTALTNVASDNNSGTAAGTSKLMFNATAGIAYQIAVDGVGGAGGNSTLNLNYAYVFSTIAGLATYGSADGSSSTARFSIPWGVARDASGNVFVADTWNHTIRRIDVNGNVTTFAGMAGVAATVDGTGSAARFNYPAGIAVGGNGYLYVSEWGGSVIRKITPGGVVTTLAGVAGVTGSLDGSTALFYGPTGLAVDGSGNVFVADLYNCTIRRVSAAGVVTTIAGLAGNTGVADGTGAQARFSSPWAIVLDGSGNLFVADFGNSSIKKITPDGVVTTFAGTAGTMGFVDGTGTAARFHAPRGLAIDNAGNLFVADTLNHTIRKITASGVVTTLAGTPNITGGADGTGSAALFNGPAAVVPDGSGGVFVADAENHAIRRITAPGVVTTLAGRTSSGSVDGTGSNARFNNPRGIAVDTSGNVLVADTDNSAVRKISPAGVVTTLAGSAGLTGNADGNVSAARFDHPEGLAVDANGTVFVADTQNRLVRKITPAGLTSTFAGNAPPSMDDFLMNEPRFTYPTGIVVKGDGTLLVADGSGIRGVMTTGAMTYFGQSRGTALAIDASGNLFNTGGYVIYKISPGGTVTTFAGNSYGARDGVASQAFFGELAGVVVDGSGNVFVADARNHAIRKASATGVVTTVAGVMGTPGIADGTESAARFYAPRGIAFDGNGNIFVADTSNNAIRKGVPSYALVPPVLTSPVAQAATAGSAATFSVSATGNGTLAYQWRRNGVPLTDGAKYSGTNSATLTVTGLQMLDAGAFDVVVTSGFGASVTSATAALTVAPTQYPAVMRIDPAFAPQIEAVGGTVNTIARQADGKLVVGGTFTRINGVARRNLARLNTDGTVDPTFDPGPGPDNTVSRVLLQPDGKVLLGGAFSHYGNAARGGIARANADGSLDATFGPGQGVGNSSMPWLGSSGSVSALALQSDGRIVVGGQFTSYDGVTCSDITRVKPDGSIDLTFSPGSGAGGYVADIAVVTGDKLLIAGGFAVYNGTTRNGVARLFADGSLDPAFVPVTATDFEAYSVVSQPDGKILVGADNFSSSTPNMLRLNSDGSRDTGFNAISLRSVHAIALQGDGAIVVGGGFGTYNGAPRSHVLRLTSTGAFDSAFNTGGAPDFQTNALVLQPDGRVVAGGRFVQVEGSTRSALARLGTNGAIDTTFAGDVHSSGTVEAMVQQPDGKFLLGGRFDYVNGVSRKRIARLLADGSLDPTFSPAATLVTGVIGAVVTVDVFVLQSDGKILVGGSFDRINGAARVRVARLLADGTVDSTFDPGAGGNSIVYAMALQPDGKILLGGLFSTFGGVARNCIARINSNGTLDTTFDPGAGASTLVFSLAVQPDGRALVGGWFSTYNGTGRPGMARVMSDGSLDPSFVPAYTNMSTTQAFLLEPDGKIYAAGFNRLFRLNADGSVDGAFANGDLAVAGNIGTITKQPDGKLLVAQATNSSATPTPIGLARVNADGTRDDSFAVVGLLDAHASAIRLLDDGSLLLAGALFSDGTTSQAGLARLIRVTVATIATQPVNQTVVAGGAVTLSVTASGVGPFSYEWRRNGVTIAGGTDGALVIGSVSAANAGDYTVAVTNPAGTVVSTAATLTVLPAVAPTITTPPQSQAASTGGSLTLDVHVSGSTPLFYQWRRNGVDIAGATGATLAIASVQAGDAGDYTVLVTNAGGNASSAAATITVIPAGFSATHALVGQGYQAGGTITVTNTFTYSGTLSALGWQVLLPDGWSFASESGASAASSPSVNQTGFLEWAWITPPPSGTTFTYTLNIPAGAVGSQSIAALYQPRQSGSQYTMLVKPDPLVVDRISFHSADTNHDFKLSLTELLRVIELYNTRNGTVRTGAYDVATTTTEDGFAGDATRSSTAVVALAHTHSADSNHDGKLSLTELLRVIELYNHRTGSVRDGLYHVLITSEDGFSGGP